MCQHGAHAGGGEPERPRPAVPESSAPAEGAARRPRDAAGAPGREGEGSGQSGIGSVAVQPVEWTAADAGVSAQCRPSGGDGHGSPHDSAAPAAHAAGVGPGHLVLA